MKYLIKNANEKQSEFIVDNLIKYNLIKLPIKGKHPVEWVNKIIENESGETIAGILSKIYCDSSIYIDALWVDKNYRKEGLGSKLLREIEMEGKKRNCHLIHLDTFDFQGKDFYLKHKYEIFGVLENCPKDNHKRYFMKKNIKL